MKMPSTRRAFGGGYATDCGISMNDSARSKVPGFAATCWKFRDKIIWSWDFGAAALVLIVAVLTPSDAQVVSMSPGLATAALALGGAMVGVVVAALAVIVALLDDELLDLMDQDTRSGGVQGHLFPYSFF